MSLFFYQDRIPLSRPAPSGEACFILSKFPLSPLEGSSSHQLKSGALPVLLSCAARSVWPVGPSSSALLSTLGLCWLPALLTSQALFTLAGSSAHLPHPRPRMACITSHPQPSTPEATSSALYSRRAFPPTQQLRPCSQLPSRTRAAPLSHSSCLLPARQESTDVSDLCYAVLASVRLPLPRSIQQTLGGTAKLQSTVARHREYKQVKWFLSAQAPGLGVGSRDPPRAGGQHHR